MRKLKSHTIQKNCGTCYGRLLPEAFCPDCKVEHAVNSHWEPGYENCETCLFKGHRTSQARGFSEGMYFCNRFPPNQGNAWPDVTTHYDNWCGEWQLDSEYAIK